MSQQNALLSRKFIPSTEVLNSRKRQNIMVTIRQQEYRNVWDSRYQKMKASKNIIEANGVVHELETLKTGAESFG